MVRDGGHDHAAHRRRGTRRPRARRQPRHHRATQAEARDPRAESRALRRASTSARPNSSRRSPSSRPSATPSRTTCARRCARSTATRRSSPTTTPHDIGDERPAVLRQHHRRHAPHGPAHRRPPDVLPARSLASRTPAVDMAASGADSAYGEITHRRAPRGSVTLRSGDARRRRPEIRRCCARSGPICCPTRSSSQRREPSRSIIDQLPARGRRGGLLRQSTTAPGST